MNRPINYFFILALLFSKESISQKQADNWYFGIHAGLNFSSGSPVALTNGQTDMLEGVSTISDVSGNLLFYSDGITVWNKLHQTMLNGFGLFGHISSTQSSIIIPQPSNDSIYYIFTVDAYAQPNGLRYSIVNMNLDGGKGSVIAKNSPLLNPICEKVTAVRHCNNRDIWVITRQYNGSNYYAWLVTPTGISASPVISSTGYHIGNSFYNGSDAIGYLKASPDGSKIIAVHYFSKFCEFAKFDNSTGLISNTLKISSVPPIPELIGALKIDTKPYGVEFSPDSRLLYLDLGLRVYLTDTVNRTYDQTTTNQYNITIHDSATIAQSHFFVDSVSNISSSTLTNALQLSNNGIIYKTHYGTNSLCVISNPNIQGIGCNYQTDAINLGTGFSQLGLPNFVTSYFATPAFSSTGNCNSLTSQFQISNSSNIDSVKWDFGDAASGPNNNSVLLNPSHTFSANGNYLVTLLIFSTNVCGNRIDTLTKNVWVGSLFVNLGNDRGICAKDTITLLTNVPNAVHQWNTGSTDTLLKVTQPGTYWVKVTLNSCETTDTINITANPSAQFTLGNDTAFCSSTGLLLFPTPNFANATYLWSNNATTSSISVTTPNSYWLRLTNVVGCRWQDTIVVALGQALNINLGNDTTICEKDTLFLNATLNGASNYLWNTGQSAPIIKAYQTDIYWCDVTKDGCTSRDSLILTLKPRPNVNLGNDTTLCENKTLTLNANSLGATYLWQDASTNATFLVIQKGLNYVKAEISGCVTRDSINVFYDLKPKFSLGEDKLLCLGSSIILDPKIDNVNYLWQDGSTNKTFNARQSGIYYLAASNYCGTTTDSIILNKGICELFVPNAFTPNDDTKNELFKIGYGDNIVEFQMQVFNRYGQLVFKTSDKNNGWDGKVNGKSQQQGTYAWQIRYRTTSSGNFWQNMQGTVLLLR